MALLFAKNNSLSAVTALPASISGGALTLLQTQTASSSSTIDFTSNIDSTYKEYIFKLVDIHLATDQANLTFQADTGTNTNYNQTVTSSYFRANHTEDDGTANLSIDTSRDQSQGTGFIEIISDLTDDNDSGSSGTINLFDPSSSVFVKHFICITNAHHHNPGTNVSRNMFIGGYFNTTTALTRIRFKASSGNIDSGTFKMYGVT